mmetsp:Transcript_40700/g.68084  ORF Transcript_40700/g.68084 Transcript_40700/m.68084 type:complete len:124 (+) Transcript_40700:917-1288(+)
MKDPGVEYDIVLEDRRMGKLTICQKLCHAFTMGQSACHLFSMHRGPRVNLSLSQKVNHAEASGKDGRENGANRTQPSLKEKVVYVACTTRKRDNVDAKRFVRSMDQGIARGVRAVRCGEDVMD